MSYMYPPLSLIARRLSSCPAKNKTEAILDICLDCVKSRQRPNADVEEGHRSAVMCHLGNISTRLGRSVRWDATSAQIVGDAEANRMLARPYRRPWRLA